MAKQKKSGPERDSISDKCEYCDEELHYCCPRFDLCEHKSQRGEVFTIPPFGFYSAVSPKEVEEFYSKLHQKTTVWLGEGKIYACNPKGKDVGRKLIDILLEKHTKTRGKE